MCPIEKFWWGESDLHSPLARLACPCSRSGHEAGMEPWGYTSQIGLIIDRIRQGRMSPSRLVRTKKRRRPTYGLNAKRRSSRTSYNPYIGYSRWIYGCLVQRSLFASSRSEILHHRKCWTTVRSLVLFYECSPTGLVLIEEVPIDPEVMAATEGLVYSVRERSNARVCRCSKRGIPRNVKRDVRG